MSSSKGVKGVKIKKSNGTHLWWSLLSLGFEKDEAASHLKRTNVKHIHLGTDMFDKPNKDAFYIVSHFLLEKLDPTRFHDSYRHCWPVLDHQADAAFRKITCAWLREIMDFQVVASLFLSPGGPKFANLMLHLANYVMLQKIKKFTTDGSWVPETAAMTTSSLHMSRNRCKLTRARFLKHCVEQDHLLHEYQRRAQIIVKSSRDHRAELAKYEHLKRHSVDAAQDGLSLELKTQKVRGLWLAFDGLLAAIQEEWRVTDCVARGDVDQYCLDGRDFTLKLSRVLLDRIEQLPQHLSTGNVFEGGQLNLLCVLELMNHALQLLREEWKRTGTSSLLPINTNLQRLEEKRLQMASVLDDLLIMRHKISEEVPKMRNDIKKLDMKWDRKWGSFQGSCPLTSNEEPALAFLWTMEPMAPLSFDVENNASSSRANIFSQYRAVLLEFSDAETKSQRSTAVDSDLESIRSPPGVERAESPVVTAADMMLLQGNSSLCDLLETEPCLPVKTTPLPQQEKVSVRKTVLPRPKLSAVEKKDHILDRECDNLADQFADAVTTDGRTKGLDLEDLLITMGGDPFSTRKQLPRTPESLILDIKSSWQKALKAKSLESSTLERDASLREIYFSPLAETDEVFGKPQAAPSSPHGVSYCDPAASTTTLNQQGAGASHTFTPSGDSTSDMEALLFGPTGTGVVIEASPHFSLQNETLPEASHFSLQNKTLPEASHFSLQNETLPEASHFSLQNETLPEASHFSLQNETLPDVMDSDSMLSLGGGDDDAGSNASTDTEDELLLPDIPSLAMEARRTPLAARRHVDRIQQACSDLSFTDDGGGKQQQTTAATPDCLSSRHFSSYHLSHIMESPAGPTGQVFSLDLDSLDSRSPLREQEFSLPNLVTFSPLESGSPSSKKDYSLPQLVTFSPIDDL